MDPPNPIVDQAVALSAGGSAHDGALGALVQLAGDEPGPLEEARRILVGRLVRHADDYDASRALTLVNGAIAQLGWHGDFTWTPRKRRLRNLS